MDLGHGPTHRENGTAEMSRRAGATECFRGVPGAINQAIREIIQKQMRGDTEADRRKPTEPERLAVTVMIIKSNAVWPKLRVPAITPRSAPLFPVIQERE